MKRFSIEMRVLVVAVAVMALAVVGGCGGGKKSVAPATTTAGSTTSAVKPTFASTKNCQQLIALGAKLSQAMQASSGGSNSIADEANVFKALASAAPAEIRGDFETFADAMSAYAQALTKAGFKRGKVPTPAQSAAFATAIKSLSTPKLRAAEQHISTWAQKNCGLGTTTTG